MKYLKLFILALLVVGSTALNAQNDLICIEVTDGDETYTIGVSEDVLPAFEVDGLSYTIVDCDEDFSDFGDDFDFGDEENWDDYLNPGDLVCVEFTEEGESFVIPIPEACLPQLDEEGVEYTVVDCEEVDFDFGDQGDWDDYEEEDWGDFEEEDWGDIICIQFTEEGQTVVLPIFEGELSFLDEEGLEYEIVDCEDDFGFGDEDWGDFDDEDYGDDWGDEDFGDLVCVEVTEEGETFILPLPEELLAELDAEGLEYTIVDCEGDFGFGDGNGGDDFDEEDWGDYDGDDYDLGELICIEVTEEGETFVLPMYESDLEWLDVEGLEYTVVDCEDDFGFGDGNGGDDFDEEDWGDFDGDDYDLGELICIEVTEEGETFVLPMYESDLEWLDLEGIEYTVVDCEDDFGFGDGNEGDDFDEEDWGDYDLGELICVEITEEGETYVLPFFEGDLVFLDEEGLEYSVVDCEDVEFEDFDCEGYDDEGDWDFEEGDYEDYELDFICVEMTEEGETFILPIPEEFLEALDSEGIEYTIVDCEEGLNEESDENGFVPNVFSYEFSIEDLSMSPNPAQNSDIVNINFNSGAESPVSVTLYNQLGQIAKDIQVTTTKGFNTVQIESSDLDAGLYIVSISNNQNINVTDKLIVK